MRGASKGGASGAVCAEPPSVEREPAVAETTSNTARAGVASRRAVVLCCVAPPPSTTPAHGSGPRAAWLSVAGCCGGAGREAGARRDATGGDARRERGARSETTDILTAQRGAEGERASQHTTG